MVKASFCHAAGRPTVAEMVRPARRKARGADGVMMTAIVLPMVAGLVLFAHRQTSHAEPVWLPGSDSLAPAWTRSMAGPGVALGGEFRSRFLRSAISGALVLDSLRQTEVVAFTGADMHLAVSAGSGFGGQALFRIQHDWSDFFASAQNSFFTRWISIDGQTGPLVYNVGDFREEFTPLTLHLPLVKVLYEPVIFARGREEAMRDQLIWNNERTLQGIKFGLNASLMKEATAILDTIDVRVLGVRLRQTEIPSSGIFAPIETGVAEEYLLGGRAAVRLSRGIDAGANCLWSVDRKDSYAGDRVFGDLEDYREMGLRNGTVVGIDGGLRLHELFHWEKLRAHGAAEYAYSHDRPMAPLDSIRLTGSLDYVRTDTIDLAGSRGGALLVQGGLSMEGRLFTPSLHFSFHHNEPGYQNELAQSPSFVPNRVANVENDTAWARGNREAAQYSTFDALYHHVFRFRPAEDGGALNRNAPATKSSFSDVVFTQRELRKLIDERFDQALQLAMPMGPATPNRWGMEGIFTGTMARNVEMTALLGTFAQLSPEDSAHSVKRYRTAGAGLKFGIGQERKWPISLRGSCSYTVSDMRGEVRDSGSSPVPCGVSTNFANLGLRVGFLRRVAILGGYQRIATTASLGESRELRVQHHGGAGLEYEIGRMVFIRAVLERIAVDDRSLRERDFAQLISDVSLCVSF